MNKESQPPFKIGDEVVCVDDYAPKQLVLYDVTSHIQKGNHYQVLGLEQEPCGCWVIDIGLRDYKLPGGLVECLKCGVSWWDDDPIMWLKASRFRKVERNYESAISEILEKFPIREEREVDLPIEVVNN